MNSRSALFLAATCGAVSCRAVAPSDLEARPEWVRVEVAGVDRRGSDADLVDDAVAYTLEGGYDLVRTPRWRAGIELGVTWSRHDVVPIVGTDDDPQLDVLRWMAGAQAALRLFGGEAALWVDAGASFRYEDADDEPDYDQQGAGSYFGAGFDVYYVPGARMGPFVRVHEFSENDLREVLVGIGATIHL